MNTLLKKVEQTRKLMVQSGLQYGLLDAKTIKLSKRLDDLLNLYSESYEKDVRDLLGHDEILQ